MPISIKAVRKQSSSILCLGIVTGDRIAARLLCELKAKPRRTVLRGSSCGAASLRLPGNVGRTDQIKACDWPALKITIIHSTGEEVYSKLCLVGLRNISLYPWYRPLLVRPSNVLGRNKVCQAFMGRCGFPCARIVVKFYDVVSKCAACVYADCCRLP